MISSNNLFIYDTSYMMELYEYNLTFTSLIIPEGSLFDEYS